MLLSALNLTGCMATMGLMNATDDGGQYATGKEMVVLKDTVVAIGQANKPIVNHEHALVLVGETNSYLVEPRGQNKQIFENMFKLLDLSALYIGSKSSESTTKKLTIDMDRSYCEAQHGCHVISLNFNKPLIKVTNKEKNLLKQLDFQCHESDTKDDLICNRSVDVEFTIAEKVANFDKLQYRFKQPITIEFMQHNTNKSKTVAKKGAYNLFILPAMAIDVVTFPLQFLFYYPQIKESGF